jgi:hypothetical protein
MDFLKNGVIADSLDDENCLGYLPLFYGTYILFQVREKGDRVVKLDGDGFIYDEFPELWIKYNTFIDSTGSSVYYASEDCFSQ